MKVIRISNHNLDYYKQLQCSFDGLTKKEAEDIAEGLNRPLDGYSADWHIVVEDDYVLDDGDPNT